VAIIEDDKSSTLTQPPKRVAQDEEGDLDECAKSLFILSTLSCEQFQVSDGWTVQLAAVMP
jgi:hypothetical protein